MKSTRIAKIIKEFNKLYPGGLCCGADSCPQNHGEENMEGIRSFLTHALTQVEEENKVEAEVVKQYIRGLPMHELLKENLIKFIGSLQSPKEGEKK